MRTVTMNTNKDIKTIADSMQQSNYELFLVASELLPLCPTISMQKWLIATDIMPYLKEKGFVRTTRQAYRLFLGQ